MAGRLRLTVGDLRTILSRAAGRGRPAVQIIGMNYYVPELAQWRHGRTGQELAVLTERLVNGYNILLSGEYAAYGAGTADVFAAFHSADFTDRVRLPGVGRLPRNVATICKLTWACAPAPRGPNEHANDLGYAIIGGGLPAGSCSSGLVASRQFLGQLQPALLQRGALLLGRLQLRAELDQPRVVGGAGGQLLRSAPPRCRSAC